MTKNIRTVLLLAAVILTPLLLYALLQVKSLEEDEETANQIYQKQLETIMFSLNQYADDMMDSWVRKLTNEKHPLSKNASDLLLANESIQMLVIRQMSNRSDSICVNDYVISTDDTRRNINNWYDSKDSVLFQLTKYLDAGFQKIQPATDWQAISGLQPAQSGITVMLYDRDSTLYNALFILETNYWIEQTLGSKMQESAQDNLRIAVLQSADTLDTPRIAFSTETFDLDKDYIRNELWILPNTSLAIQTKGESYAELIRSRSRNNLYILLASISTMLLGTLIMLRNIRNTVRVAQLKSDFVSNVSHEIRTPLSLIKMYAETLMLGRLPSEEKKKHYYEVIHHEAGRLTYLVNNILDFSKIEANKKTYRLEAQDLNEPIPQLIEHYSHTLREKGIRCELSLSSSPLLVNLDLQAFDEALSNLIENAIKYHGDSDQLKISTYRKGDHACCEIKDHGIGIPKSAQRKIFDKFYRVEHALTQKTKGTGLGLSLVQHIMTSHGGRVTVDSILNQGSTFTLCFPLNQTST
ncbi:cell wall metabolism sensor histidine kinase WalK [Reichenbachiella sp. MSK19-1]|uniref:sensor histidine kinase n=1 Tax=Reichenbachiella sp. MSK19-1 TaxID=1897631 RepID=UPI000E6C39E5|nr:HAMP domain-containing sensor histidine kinase [Reichenbachiella sp. MSK19-1]RJE72787.1 hypothetical protein BGP76_02195 [Reichenbachiella sp. MSK19-1]